MLRVVIFFACLVWSSLSGAAGAAANASFKGVDVTGQGYGGAFRLVGHDGKPRTQASFAGKIVVMSFGFTQCPDVCPTTLATLAQTTSELGEEAKSVQALFVTIDPERDSADALSLLPKKYKRGRKYGAIQRGRN